MPPERRPSSTSSSSARSSPPSQQLGSMLRLWSTRTLVSPSGMSGVRTRSDLSGGITSRTPRGLSLLWTAMTGIVLLKLGMSSIGCLMRMSCVMLCCLSLPTNKIFQML